LDAAILTWLVEEDAGCPVPLPAPPPPPLMLIRFSDSAAGLEQRPAAGPHSAVGETIGEWKAEHVLVTKRITLMRRTAMKKILTMPLNPWAKENSHPKRHYRYPEYTGSKKIGKERAFAARILWL